MKKNVSDLDHAALLGHLGIYTNLIRWIETYGKRMTDDSGVKYYRVPVAVIEHLKDNVQTDLVRMTNAERNVHHEGSLLWYQNCPDETPHNFVVDPVTPSYMCDTAYICTKCGWTKRVDSSD